MVLWYNLLFGEQQGKVLVSNIPHGGIISCCCERISSQSSSSRLFPDSTPIFDSIPSLPPSIKGISIRRKHRHRV
ncbi:unnamed protein product, partial [Brassica oleracea]